LRHVVDCCCWEEDESWVFEVDLEKRDVEKPVTVPDDAVALLWCESVLLSSVLLESCESGGEREANSPLEPLPGVPNDRCLLLPLRRGEP